MLGTVLTAAAQLALLPRRCGLRGLGQWVSPKVGPRSPVMDGPRARRVALYLAAERPLDRARKRSRPIRVTIAPPRTATLRPLPRRKQSGLEPLSCLHAALWQPHQLISGRAPTARTKILHTRGSSAPRWMGLVSRTADRPTRHPQSHIRPGLWPRSVGQTHSTVSGDDCVGRHLPGLDVPPESDHELARERNDHDASDPTLEVSDAPVIPER
jgi:hypothetical protein